MVSVVFQADRVMLGNLEIPVVWEVQASLASRVLLERRVSLELSVRRVRQVPLDWLDLPDVWDSQGFAARMEIRVQLDLEETWASPEYKERKV